MSRFLALVLCLGPLFGAAQIPVGGELRYGNEWIANGTAYLRVAVAEDGVYHLTAQQLAAAELSANDLILHHRGEVLPLLQLADGGVAFVGQRNRGWLDRFLFAEAGDQLNTRYSMHTDTAVYFLSAGKGRYYDAAQGGGGAREPRILRSSELVYGQAFSKEFFRTGGLNSSSIFYSHYDTGEGFGLRSNGNLLDINAPVTTEATLELPHSTGAGGVLRFRGALAFGSHRQRVSLNGTPGADITANLWHVGEYAYDFSPAAGRVTLALSGEGGDSDRFNLAWVEATYPAEPRLEAEGRLTFALPAGPAATLDFSGAAAGAYYLLDPAAATSLSAEASGGTLSFPLPARADTTVFHLVAAGRLLPPAASVRMTLAADDLLPEPTADYLLVTSRRLRGPALDDFVAYRSSSAGGGYRVHRVDVEDLYDHFGYGIRRHPQAVRNYLAAARRRAPGLRYLFLVGKGREYPDLRTAEQLQRARATFFLPSFGFPASDNLLSAPPGGVVPELAVGRLSAVSESEIAGYVRKLRGVEAQNRNNPQTLEAREWMKKWMHLGGGVTASEQTIIRANLARMERTIENRRLGGDVVSFFKTSSDPIENSRQDAIFERINQGTAVITFYGHSSSQGFDFSIDDPDNYRNFDRYPYMLSLGCYSGDAFTEARSISERFLFLRDKGAVAFAASKGVGFVSALGQWGDNYYDLLGDEYYGQGIGDALRANIAHFRDTRNWTIGILLEQFSLSGDPAYRLHPRPEPDLLPDEASVSFSPEIVPAQEENFTMNLRVVNIGRGTPDPTDSVTVLFRQQLPDGSLRELRRARVAVPDFDADLSVRLPNLGFVAVGQNRILVTVDADDVLAEGPGAAAESNNELRSAGQLGVPLTIAANTAKVAAPAPYATVGGSPELVAASTDPLAPEQDYLIQLATDAAFRNRLVAQTITRPGGIIRYRPAVNWADSTTYYWRISPDSTQTPTGRPIWNGSSFTYVAALEADRTGWAQQHPGQTIDGTFTNVRGNARTEGWNFAQTITDVRIVNGVFTSRQLPRFERDGFRLNSPHPWLVRHGMHVLVIDSLDFTKWMSNPGRGQYATRPGRATDPWIFDTTVPEQREGLMDFLDNGIPPGKYVYVWSVQRGDDIEYYSDDWLADSARVGRTIFDVLEQRGAELVRRLTTVGSVPYIFVYQNGLGPLDEVMAESAADVISSLTAPRQNWSEGRWSTPPVGPSLGWRSLHVGFAPTHVDTVDQVELLLYGRQPGGGERLLSRQPLRLSDRLHFRQDLSEISADQYPYLRAEVAFSDERDRTVPTLTELYFGYQRPGDAAVSPAVALELPDSLVAGQDAALRIGYENLGPTGMDSLLVRVDLLSGARQLASQSVRQPPLPRNGRGVADLSFPTTAELDGKLRLRVVLNPGGDQPEEVLFNNDLGKSFNLARDVIAPDLQVFFDGRRISNGDLVSSRPEIMLQLRDESRFLRLTDTAGYLIELTGPDGNRERLSFGDERVEFVPPAEGEDNAAEVFFRPELDQDGEYTLSVRAADRSGNRSGRLDFRQQFIVFNQQTISNVLAYPNPFTTSTQFVYTLTGNASPKVFRIQIMTVSGRVVRDIDILDHESLRVGTHRTDYRWDGTDEYGDPLANGVYLYRIITQDETGQQVAKAAGDERGTDRFFRNGIGKLVIVR